MNKTKEKTWKAEAELEELRSTKGGKVFLKQPINKNNNPEKQKNAARYRTRTHYE